MRHIILVMLFNSVLSSEKLFNFLIQYIDVYISDKPICRSLWKTSVNRQKHFR